MHEEHEVANKAQNVVINTGQLVLKPSRVLLANILRVINAKAQDKFVYTLGGVDFLGDSGKVTLRKLGRLARKGVSSTNMPEMADGETDRFIELMHKCRVPITVYYDAKSQSKYLCYPVESEGAVKAGLDMALGWQIAQHKGLIPQDDHRDPKEALDALDAEQKEDVETSARRLTDPERYVIRQPGHEDVLDLKAIKEDSGFAVNPLASGTGYMASVTDDKGDTIHAVMNATGDFEVFKDGVNVASGRERLGAFTLGEDQHMSLPDAMMNMLGTLQSFATATLNEQEYAKALKTPLEQKKVAQESVARSVRARDQGPREEVGKSL